VHDLPQTNTGKDSIHPGEQVGCCLFWIK